MKFWNVVSYATRWSALKAVGGSYLGALTILTPVIGYLLLLPGLEVSFGGVELIEGHSITALGGELTPSSRMLYIGLFVIGIATMGFRLACPEQIATQSNAPSFLASEKSAYSAFKLRSDLEKAANISNLNGGEERGTYFASFKISDQKKTGNSTSPLKTSEFWELYEQIANDVLTVIYDNTNISMPVARVPIGLAYVVGMCFVLWPSFATFVRVVSN